MLLTEFAVLPNPSQDATRRGRNHLGAELTAYVHTVAYELHECADLAAVECHVLQQVLCNDEACVEVDVECGVDVDTRWLLKHLAVQ